MRWYKITAAGMTFDATGDPNALNVELDIPVSPQHTTAGAFCRVWGIPLATILKANSLNNQPISVYGGMQQGLPLANPAQQGLLVQGQIFPCLGNWVETDMTLDFYIKALGGDANASKPINAVHYWQAGQPLATAIKQTLQTALPGYTPSINISPQLIAAYTQTSFYQTIGQYATDLRNISLGIMNSPGYRGVQIVLQGSKALVFDGTQPQQGGNVMINFQDLIGQPIWTGPKTVQFKTVMRGDLTIPQTVTLPKALATTTVTSSLAPGNSNTNIIQGNFTITQMRHTGNFRQPDWKSWCTTFDAVQAA